MSLRSTVDRGYAEMSIKQLDHMWQIGFSGEFDEYNEDFCEDGWDNDTPEFPLDDIQNVVITNFYVQDDDYCKPETQMEILDHLSEYKFTMTNAFIDHVTIAGANDQMSYLALLKFALEQGSNIDVPGECSGFDNDDWM